MWVYLDGEFVEDHEATVPITDRSFLYGDGCFEGIGVYNGRLPHLDDHVRRMFASARMLRIPMPVEERELRGLILETARRNGMADADGAYLRPLLTRGSGPLGVKHSRTVGPSRLVIIPQIGDRRVDFGDEAAVLTAVISRYVRAGASSLDPGVKSNNYLTSILAYLEADDRGADIAVLLDDRGFVSEGHAMNIFCVVDQHLLTPMASASLRGITRRHVLRVAQETGVPCHETNLTPYDLRCADEVFVTSAMESIAAVASVDTDAMPGPIPGPVTTALRTAYLKHAWETGTPVPT
jgi:branched-chain amino acid aminotransferase